MDNQNTKKSACHRYYARCQALATWNVRYAVNTPFCRLFRSKGGKHR